MQAGFGGRVIPSGGVGRREAASRAPWEGWRRGTGIGGWCLGWKGRSLVGGAQASFRGAGEGWWERTEPMGGGGVQKRFVERIAAELEGPGMYLGRHRAGADFAEPVVPSVYGTSLRAGGWGGIGRACGPAMESWQGHRKGKGRKVEGLRGGRKTTRPSRHRLPVLPGPVFCSTFGDSLPPQEGKKDQGLYQAPLTEFTFLPQK